MKKIAFIINVFREDNFHSGGEKLYYELLVKAIEQGYCVDLYCTKYLFDKAIPELKPKINKLEIFGNSKDYKYPEKIEKLYQEISAKVSKENYDFVISENITPPIGMAVLQGHSLLHYKNMAGNTFAKSWFFLKKHKFINSQKKWIKQGYKKIFVPSFALKNEIKNNFNVPEEKFIVVYPGVEMPLEQSENNFTDVIENKRDIVFGISAPSFSKKGGFIFLQALNILKKNNYKFKAKVIYPKAKKNLSLLVMLKILGLESLVEFVGYQDDMNDFYSSIDCLVMPSLLETFGLVALESMSYKKPAIVSSYSGASEIIKDTENGFVFDMNKQPSKNLANKMTYILENKDKLNFISQNAFNTAKLYSWNKAAETFINNL